MGWDRLCSAGNPAALFRDGNGKAYDFDKIKPIDTPLKGRRVCVLGSSVVFGSASQGFAVAEYLNARLGCVCTKEAVCGTTLVDRDRRSYVSRLKALDKSVPCDLFLCQLSTNDATQKLPLGEITAGDDLDTATVTGAMAFIIQYVRRTWGCPVAFFTGSRYDSEAYRAMVDRLYELKEKYEIGVFDLFRGDAFNSISDEARRLYLHDPIHPTKAGYRDWWGPELEKQLLAFYSG